MTGKKKGPQRSSGSGPEVFPPNDRINRPSRPWILNPAPGTVNRSFVDEFTASERQVILGLTGEPQRRRAGLARLRLPVSGIDVTIPHAPER